MKYEEAEERARYMISVLGKTWVMDLKDTHGWRCQVKNGPCTVTFNENQVNYQAVINVGPTFTGYSAESVLALDIAAGKLDIYLNRITAERDAVVKIIDGTYPDTRL